MNYLDRIYNVLTETQRESDRYNPDAGKAPGAARRAETGSGSDFKPGEGPKDTKDMTRAEILARDIKTAALIRKRDAKAAKARRGTRRKK